MRSRTLTAALAVAVSLLLVTGCSTGSSSNRRSDSSALKMAFSYDPGSLDPNVFYDGEGSTIIEAAYEGLVQYSGDSSTTIEPLLATSWDVSPDSLTYTFQLRDGVKFHDGTEMTSQTWKSEFERRKAMEQGSAYLTSDVEKILTPDPHTLVLQLSQPVSAFLHYLASPYGIRAVSPTAVEKHTVKGDHGTGWLANNSAGTGPYLLTDVTPGQSYLLKAFGDYWGTKASFEQVQFSMVPSFTTQQVMLQRGELDLVYHGISHRDMAKFEGDKYQIQDFPSIVRLNLWINTHAAPFDDPEVRAAAAQALDRDKIVEQVFGDTADTAEQIFPAGLPEGVGTYDPEHDPSVLKKLAPTLETRKVDLAYTTDDALNAQVAQLVQSQLSAAGLDVTTRGVTQQTTWAWPTKPDGRASMLILPANPDNADASSWPTTFFAQDGGLSYFSPTNTAKADALIKEGLNAADPNVSAKAYAAAAEEYLALDNAIPLADEHAVVVARAGLCGWTHNYSTLWTIRPQTVKAC
jgi:peptide/nickel transport system substrate-binding protein